MEPNVIESLITELQKLQNAREMLRDVYIEYGSYGDGEISNTTLMRMRNYFEFDDSE